MTTGSTDPAKSLRAPARVGFLLSDVSITTFSCCPFRCRGGDAHGDQGCAPLRVARSSNVTMERASEQRKRVPEERCRSDSRGGTKCNACCRLRLPDLVRDVRRYCCRRGLGRCRPSSSIAPLACSASVRWLDEQTLRGGTRRLALTSNGDVLRAVSLHGGQPRRTHAPTPRFRPTFCGAETRAARPAQRDRRSHETRRCHAHPRAAQAPVR